MTDSIADPFATPVDESDPFATPEDVKRGGSFTPTPFFDSLAGRLIVLVPRAFEKEAKKRADRIEPGGKDTEERYTVDMVVLDGGPLTFWYNAKVEGSDERELQEITISDLPHMWTNVWRTEGNVVGALKKIDGSARPMLLGRVRRGPQKPDRDKGMTTSQVEAAYEAWEKRGKNGPKPKFSWLVDVDVVTDADRQLAKMWYTKARAEGFTL